jgi:hypothetical protein
MNALLIAAIIEKGLIYGPTCAAQIAALFEKREPTPEDIRALEIEKEPEQFFGEGEG